ncbi:MAG: DEAD/DEAH box helicase family protein [Spirochaetota bacterium]
MPNQNPEQIARDTIDAQLAQAGWIVQSKDAMNLAAGPGVAVREYQTDVGPADYVLFIDKKPLGIIEAKRAEEGHHLSVVEAQSDDYAHAKLKHLNNEPLRFIYESTGELTRFRDAHDPKPRSRPVFSFHRPETLRVWSKQDKPLRARLLDLPELNTDKLRDCQITGINNLEKSLKDARPKALVQMATGSGKTFTAITSIYRLLKFAKAGRVLFLVDTKNLGEQAEQEFQSYTPNDDNRKFTELYGVTRLRSGFIPRDSKVYISTIQRMYSVLKGTELEEAAEELNPNEIRIEGKEPMPVVYNEKIAPEFFDFIVIDECHRSIYNLWKQVLDYFDAFQIGLTATPDNRTFGYFNQNLVSDYGYEKAVLDNVLVPYQVFTIETKITQDGAKIALGERVDKRERLTRRKFWEQVDEDVEYAGKQLDKDVVNPTQIRTIVRAVKENLPAMFPDRIDKYGKFEVPKTLIFAKSDSHAEDIIEIVREEFGEGNEFCKKITYRSEEDPKSVLSAFRNNYSPRIAVTVDMIATGTDIRPLEVLLFMRDVKSRSYYEQMKGRGTRTCSLEELKKTGTPSAKFTKDHFVIIDAIGVESSLKTDSRPLERKPGLSLKEVLENVAVGNTQEEILTTLASRLLRLDKQMSLRERDQIASLAEGHTPAELARQLLAAHDPDRIEGLTADEHATLVENAVAVFHNPELRNYIVDVRKKYDQIIDTVNIDEVVKAGFTTDLAAAAEKTIGEFRAYIEAHKTEITALQIFYGQPFRRRELTYKMIKDLCERLLADKPTLAPLKVWRAYEELAKAGTSTRTEDGDPKRVTAHRSPKNELVALVSLVRHICGIDEVLSPYDKTVDRKFQEWVFNKQSGKVKYDEEQMAWLRMIKDFVANSFHIEKGDFDLSPFNARGGLSKMWQLFGEGTEKILDELNEVLAS